MDVKSLQKLISQHGYTEVQIEPITTGEEPVFKMSVESKTYYVKALLEENASAHQRVFQQGVDVGLPPGQVVGDKQQILISEQANGWRVSNFMLFALIPGVWNVFSDVLQRGIAGIGADLGTLHSYNREESVSVEDKKNRFSIYLQIGPNVRKELDSLSIRNLERRFETVAKQPLPFTRIHGDPTPHNLYIDPHTGNETIIDFNFRPSIALDDFVTFEVGIELTVNRLPYGRQSQQNVLLSAFRDSYLETGPHNEIPQVVETLKLAYYSTMLERYLGSDSLPGKRAHLTRYTDRWVIKRQIKKYLHQDET